MQTTYKIFLALHIAGGFLALAIGLVAMLTNKGGKAHRLSGKVYVWGMTIACASAFYMSVAKPNPFLFMVGVFSYQLVAVGYRSLYLKTLRLGKQKPTWLDWTIGLVPGVFNLLMVAWGITMVVNGNMFGITGLAFGGGGLLTAYRWLRQFFVLPTDKRHWLFSHFQSMGGAYIATTTAFLVVNVSVLPPLVVWLTPGVIGGVIISFVSSKMKRKYATNAKPQVALSTATEI